MTPKAADDCVEPTAVQKYTPMSIIVVLLLALVTVLGKSWVKDVQDDVDQIIRQHERMEITVHDLEKRVNVFDITVPQNRVATEDLVKEMRALKETIRAEIRPLRESIANLTIRFDKVRENEQRD